MRPRCHSPLIVTPPFFTFRSFYVLPPSNFSPVHSFSSARYRAIKFQNQMVPVYKISPSSPSTLYLSLPHPSPFFTLLISTPRRVISDPNNTLVVLTKFLDLPPFLSTFRIPLFASPQPPKFSTSNFS